MSIRYIPILLILSVATTISFANPNPDPDFEIIADTIFYDDIIITASKIPLSERETTKPVTIISRTQIQNSGSRDLGQLLNQQSGIRVNDSYGSPANNRAVNIQGASAGYSLILVDGLAVNDPSGNGGIFDIRTLPVHAIERIEIIKGSQSTLYGTDAIAGVVNIITRKESDQPIQSNGRIAYGAYNTFEGNIGANGQIGSALGYNIMYNRESSDGISAAEEPDGQSNFGRDGYQLDSFIGRLNFQLGDYITISPFLNYSIFEGDYDGGAFTDADNYFEMEVLNPGVQAAFNRDEISINGGYNFTYTERTFTDSFGSTPYEGRLHNVDIFGSYRFTTHFQALAGLNYQSMEMPNNETEADSEILSPYATIYLRDWNGLNTELGFRINNHTEYGNNSTFTIAPSYHITDEIKLLASYNTGFKAPTLSELFGQWGANPDLKPQKSQYFNAGAEAYLLDQTLKLSALYFNRSIDDLIIYLTPEGFVNRDQQDDYGIELSADWMITSNYRAGLYYNYVHGEITTLDDDGQTETVQNLIRQPNHSIGFSGSAQITPGLQLSINGEYVGERSDIFFNMETFGEEEVTLDAYTLINLYAEYQLLDGQLTVFGEINNVLNADFTEVYGYKTKGLNTKGGLRFSF